MNMLETKLKAKPYVIMIRSILAGIYISIGCIFMTFVRTYTGLPPMISSLVSGLSFSIGLFLVCRANGELFTGNCLLFYMCDDTNTVKRVIWFLIKNYIFNFIGVIVMASIIKNMDFYPQTLQMIADTKFSNPNDVFIKGILCNMLVCLGIWTNYSSRSVTDTFISILLPVTMFISCGFEHSIADMFFIFFVGPTTSMVSVIISMILITLGNLFGGIFIANMLRGTISK